MRGLSQKAESSHSSCCSNFQRVDICFSPIQLGSVTRTQRCKTTKPQSPERVLTLCKLRSRAFLWGRDASIKTKKNQIGSISWMEKHSNKKLKLSSSKSPPSQRSQDGFFFFPGRGAGVEVTNKKHILQRALGCISLCNMSRGHSISR